MQCAIEHAAWPEIDNALALVGGFYKTEFDFRNTINQNMLKMKEEATRIKQFGLSIKEPEQTLVLVSNINKASKARWGMEFSWN